MARQMTTNSSRGIAAQCEAVHWWEGTQAKYPFKCTAIIARDKQAYNVKLVFVLFQCSARAAD